MLYQWTYDFVSYISWGDSVACVAISEGGMKNCAILQHLFCDLMGLKMDAQYCFGILFLDIDIDDFIKQNFHQVTL